MLNAMNIRRYINNFLEMLTYQQLIQVFMFAQFVYNFCNNWDDDYTLEDYLAEFDD